MHTSRTVFVDWWKSSRTLLQDTATLLQQHFYKKLNWLWDAAIHTFFFQSVLFWAGYFGKFENVLHHKYLLNINIEELCYFRIAATKCYKWYLWMQDCAHSYVAKSIRQMLQQHFNYRIRCTVVSCPLRSPNLISIDFWLCDYIKSKFSFSYLRASSRDHQIQEICQNCKVS